MKVRFLFRRDFRDVGPLIIFGPGLTLAGMFLAASSMELVFRLRKQIDHIHEVKHWIEPGIAESVFQPVITDISYTVELICYGWGHYQVGREKDDSFITIDQEFD